MATRSYQIPLVDASTPCCVIGLELLEPFEDDHEMWATIPEFVDYAVSSRGRVKRVTPGAHTSPGRILRPLPQSKNGKLYYRCALCKNGDTYLVYVHHLVARSFLGPRPVRHVVAHWDDDGSNNVVWNLRYATYAENADDAKRNGSMKVGEHNHSAKLSDDDIFAIRSLVDAGVPHKKIAARFNISPSYSCRIGMRRARA
jgi:HNH endonuclease/NUMOD4 motif-containing protein